MSFNIDKIIKECPRAWEECIRFFIHPHNYEALEFKYIWNPNTNRIEIWEGDYLDLEIHPRELYDFFDSVGVCVELINAMGLARLVLKLPQWRYRIIEENGDYIGLEERHDTRTEAEYRAFEKAFEIYEKQLGEV